MTNTKNRHSRTSTRRKASARHHSWVLALIIILIIIAIAVIVALIVKPQSATEEGSSTAETSTTDDNSTTTQKPTESTSNPDTETSEYPENKAPQYEGENPNTLEDLTGVITYSGIDDGILTIMTMINQRLEQPGTCALTLTGRSSHSSYTASVNAFFDISTSHCENFEIPTSELMPDTYNIEIQVTGDGKTGTINGEVSL